MIDEVNFHLVDGVPARTVVDIWLLVQGLSGLVHFTASVASCQGLSAKITAATPACSQHHETWSHIQRTVVIKVQKVSEM